MPPVASPGAAGANATPTCGVDVRLEGPSAADVSAVVVTVARVDVQESGGAWTTITTAPQTLSLLAPGGASLGTIALPPGHVTAIRLVLEPSSTSNVTTKDGVSHALDVPSGTTSGVEVKVDFDVPACATGLLTLGIEGGSVALHPVGTGAGDHWVLRPVLDLATVAIH
jgi:hypothetical protein